MAVAVMNTPVGQIGVREDAGRITRLTWDLVAEGEVTPLLFEALTQLAAYFDGRLTTFDLPLQVGGSEFQRAVCDAMSAIPFGETLTYGEIAKALGRPPQAVGSACGGNPIPIIIPCHRVLGAGGKMVGFSGAGGVETKVWLLRHEGAGLLI